VDLPCGDTTTASTYREHLQALVTAHTGHPAKTLAIDPQPPWQTPTVPPQVQTQAKAHQLTLVDAQWQSLTSAQRFALIKLSRPSHENRNFVPAMAEFGLIG